MKKTDFNYYAFILLGYNVLVFYQLQRASVQYTFFFLIMNTLIMLLLLNFVYKYDKNVYDFLDEFEEYLKDKRVKK